MYLNTESPIYKEVVSRLREIHPDFVGIEFAAKDIFLGFRKGMGGYLLLFSVRSFDPKSETFKLLSSLKDL